jgi:branched-chain amino acid transport system substrate-binding protein
MPHEPRPRVPQEGMIVPSAVVRASGALDELNDGRGRRLLEANPMLVRYAQAVLSCELASIRFIWAEPADGTWCAVHVQRLPRPAGGEGAAMVEAVPVAPPHGLTLRELDVLTLVAGGLSNPEIAGHLGASPRTVSTHVERLLGKLEQVSRAGAAAMAIEEGLLRLPIPGGGRAVEGLPVGVVDEVVEGCAPRLRPPAYRPPPHGRTRPRPYLIGSAAPLQGAGAADGIEMLNGSGLAIAEINARGGIAGRPVEQLVVDMDLTTTAGVASALRRLVDAEVDAITTCYSFVEDVAGYADVSAYGCPMLTSATSEVQAEWVRDERERLGSVFQAGPTEIHYGSGFVRFLDRLAGTGAWRPPNRRLIFVETPVAGGHTTLPDTIDRAECSGWEVDALISVAAHESDWSAPLAQIARSAPAAVMIAQFVASEMATFQRRFVDAPSDTLIYGVYAPSVPEYLELAGTAAEGVVWATITGVSSDRIGAAFARRYRDAYGTDPGRALAGLTYDQVNLLTSAWSRVGNPRAFDAVTDELRRLTWRGVNGTYFLGHDRQCGLSYPDETPDPSLAQAQLVFQIQDGRHRILDPAPYADGSFATPSWFGAP